MTQGPAEVLSALANQYSECDACDALCDSRSQVVFGSGSASARIVVVGSAPGAEEDEYGVPFIGDAGRLLMDLFAHAWPPCDVMESIRALDDDEDYFGDLREYLDAHIFWTNVLLCRPPELDADRNGTRKFREPSPAEKKACRDRLMRTIYAIDPLVVISVGKIASTALLGSSVAVTQKRGQIFDMSIPSPHTQEAVRYPLLVLLDPAMLLKQGDQDLMKRKRGNSYKTMEDLKWAFGLMQSHHRVVLGTSFPIGDQP